MQGPQIVRLANVFWDSEGFVVTPIMIAETERSPPPRRRRASACFAGPPFVVQQNTQSNTASKYNSSLCESCRDF